MLLKIQIDKKNAKMPLCSNSTLILHCIKNILNKSQLKCKGQHINTYINFFLTEMYKEAAFFGKIIQENKNCLQVFICSYV